MATGIQFSKNLRKRTSRMANNATNVTKVAAKSALRALVNATPVDTGQARSNWRVGVGAAPTAVISPYSPYPKGSKGNGAGVGERANASAAIAVGTSRINSVRGTSFVGLTTAIIIANNTRQIGRLNDGSSKQAPGGFVQRAFAEARQSIRNARLL